MGNLAGIALFTLASLTAAPAAAQQYWHCMVSEETPGGRRATLAQAYAAPGRPLDQPVLDVAAASGGMFFSTATSPRWEVLDGPFALPPRIILGIRLPERAASRRFSFHAPGVRPFTLRGELHNPLASEIGTSFELRDRARIETMLTHPEWTVMVHHPDGRVQQIVTRRMPVTLDSLRALRVRQVGRMREIARDPERNCTLTDDSSIVVN
jgi:hypothetical protein